MTAERLVFRDADAEAIRTGLDSLAATLREEHEAMRMSVGRRVSGWSTRSASRESQMDFDARLAQRADQFASALEAAAEAMGSLRDDAYRIEVANVAIMD